MVRIEGLEIKFREDHTDADIKRVLSIGRKVMIKELNEIRNEKRIESQKLRNIEEAQNAEDLFT